MNTSLPSPIFFAHTHFANSGSDSIQIHTAAREEEWRAPAPLRSQPLCDHLSARQSPPPHTLIHPHSHTTALLFRRQNRTRHPAALFVLLLELEGKGFFFPRDSGSSRGSSFRTLRNDGPHFTRPFDFFPLVFFLPWFRPPPTQNDHGGGPRSL